MKKKSKLLFLSHLPVRICLLMRFSILMCLMFAVQISASASSFVTPSNSGAKNDITSQQTKITGTITDATTGEKLIGVNVVVEGTTTGVSSDLNGKFSIEVPDLNVVLQISYIGYLTKKIPLNGMTVIDITLTPDIQALEEVVVVGYGTQKKESVTASVATINSKELAESPSANVGNMIAGRMTGILSVQDNGTPGNDNGYLFIRGLATTGSTAPLFVIDGIPRTGTDFYRLTPTDIESISVLKDAAGAAVYGTRGANGVLLITTKRGTTQGASFSYSVNMGFQKSTRMPRFLDSYGYAKLYNEALANEGRPAYYSAEDLQLYKDGSDPIFHPNTDWTKVLERVAPMQQHNFTVTGGNENVKYYLSYNYLDQKSILSNKLGFVRHNFRSNIDVQATKTTKVALDISGYLGRSEEPGGETYWVTRNANINPPTIVGQYPNGLYGNGDMGMNALAIPDNSGYRRRENDGVLTRLEIRQEISFIRGLSVKAIGAFDYNPNIEKDWVLQPKLYNAVDEGGGVISYEQVSGFGKPSLRERRGTSMNFILEGHINYIRSFGKNNLAGLMVFSQQQMTDEWMQAGRSEYLSPNLDIIDAGATANQLTEGSASQYRRRSIVGRISYDYDGRYLLEFNSRYDGSDLFAKGKRFGFFPAFSAGWVVSKEKFMQNISFIDNLKIRGSYGTLGNDAIGSYQYIPFYSFGPGASIGLPPSSFQNNIYLSRMANQDVTWEKSKKTDIGFESRFLKDFSLEVDLFWEKRDNILGKRDATIPSYIGINQDQMPYENFQKINNKGVEITGGYNKIFSNGLSVQTRLSVTSTHNEVIDIGESADMPARLKQEGRPLNAMYGYVALGLFQTEQQIIDAYSEDYMNEKGLKPGDIYFKDLNGDKVIDDQDRTYIGSYNVPKAIYGFNSIVKFKNFEFSMFWQAATGGEQFLSIWMAQPFVSGGKALVAHQDYWRPDNTGAKYPRITTQSNWNYGEDANTFWKYNMSYLRLKNLEIAYSLPKQLINKLFVKNLRVYYNAVNLLTFSAYKEIDPEIGSDFGNGYPQSVINNFGIQISF